MTRRKRPRGLVHLSLPHEELVDFMREHSHLYPQAAAQVGAVVEETKASVLEQVEWTLSQLKLDMNEDGEDLEGDLT
ncbi:MAG: hypothetical protein IT327_32595 [Anaerolineae bacterium]|nr:hypothetical protein [Anaerolineae bacterium]